MTLFFDFGGTLDTHGIHWFDMFADAYSHSLSEVDRAVLWDGYVAAEQYLEKERVILPSDGFQSTLRKKMLLHAEQLQFPTSVVDTALRYVNSYVSSCLTESKLLLERLHASFPIALVSNFYGNLTTVLEEIGMTSCIDVVIDSTTVGIRKPSLQIYQHALQLMNSQPTQTLMVGDSMKNDILPCRQLGLQTIWLNPKETTQTPLPQAQVTKFQQVANILSNPTLK